MIYASGGVVNLASSHMCAGGNDVTSVDSALVTRTSDFAHPDMGGGGGGEGEGEGGGAKLARGEAAADAAAPRSVSALAWVAYRDDGDDGDDDDDDDNGGDRHSGDCRRCIITIFHCVYYVISTLLLMEVLFSSEKYFL